MWKSPVIEVIDLSDFEDFAISTLNGTQGEKLKIDTNVN